MKKLAALLLLLCVVCGLAFATAEDENLRLYKNAGCNMGVPASWRQVFYSVNNDQRGFLVDDKAVVFVSKWIKSPILSEGEDSFVGNPFHIGAYSEEQVVASDLLTVKEPVYLLDEVGEDCVVLGYSFQREGALITYFLTIEIFDMEENLTTQEAVDIVAPVINAYNALNQQNSLDLGVGGGTVLIPEEYVPAGGMISESPDGTVLHVASYVSASGVEMSISAYPDRSGDKDLFLSMIKEDPRGIAQDGNPVYEGTPDNYFTSWRRSYYYNNGQFWVELNLVREVTEKELREQLLVALENGTSIKTEDLYLAAVQHAIAVTQEKDTALVMSIVNSLTITEKEKEQPDVPQYPAVDKEAILKKIMEAGDESQAFLRNYCSYAVPASWKSLNLVSDAQHFVVGGQFVVNVEAKLSFLQYTDLSEINAVKDYLENVIEFESYQVVSSERLTADEPVYMSIVDTEEGREFSFICFFDDMELGYRRGLLISFTDDASILTEQEAADMVAPVFNSFCFWTKQSEMMNLGLGYIAIPDGYYPEGAWTYEDGTTVWHLESENGKNLQLETLPASECADDYDAIEKLNYYVPDDMTVLGTTSDGNPVYMYADEVKYENGSEIGFWRYYFHSNGQFWVKQLYTYDTSKNYSSKEKAVYEAQCDADAMAVCESMTNELDVAAISSKKQAVAVNTVDQYIVITKESANIRAAANGDAKRIGTSKKGDTFPLLGEEGKWYKIDMNGETGYVNKNLAKIKE